MNMIGQQINTDVENAPLTKWKNAPNIRDLKQDLADSKAYHDAQVTKVAVWLDNLNVTGTAKIKGTDGNSKMVPKLIRKQAEWRYAALSEPFLSTDDVFNVNPITWEDKKAAYQNQLVLAHQFNTQIDKTRFIDEYVRTGVDEGTIITRVGWCFYEEEYEEQVPTVEFRVNPEIAELHQYLEELRTESPSQYDTDVPEEIKQAHDLSMEQQQPIEAVVTGYTIEKRMRTVKNHPTLEVCDYRNVFIDPTCMGNIERAGFVIYSFESNLAELRKDGKYKNLDNINVANSSVLGEPDHSSTLGTQDFNFSDQPRKKFVVYEYWGFWDIDGTGIVKPFVAAWVGNILIRLEENPYPDKQIPFVVVQYLPVRRGVYGEPDGALLEDNQKIAGAVTRGMIDLMGKSANGQSGIRKDALDPTNRRKFDKGLDYEFNVNIDPRQGMYMHVYPEIPQSAQFMLQLQNMEAESITGVKSYSQGVSGATLGDVSAGVRGALDAASKRELGILRRLAQGMVQIGRKIISMNAEFLSEEETVRVTNEQFVKIRKDDLPGNFDLTLSISTAEEDNNKAEQLAFMLQTMGNNMDPDLSKMILSDIAKLRKMPELAKKIEKYQPQPDPLAQKKAELEVALLEAQIAVEESKAQMNMANAQLDQAKSGTEGAKQGHIQSDTDLKNLEFVEQEKGVTQERDLQLHGEQARSQGKLKMMDHRMKQESKVNDVLAEYLKNR
jgi:hypothetical protein